MVLNIGSLIELNGYQKVPILQFQMFCMLNGRKLQMKIEKGKRERQRETERE